VYRDEQVFDVGDVVFEVPRRVVYLLLVEVGVEPVDHAEQTQRG